MKIEIDIGEIGREHLLEAMADKLLSAYVREEDTNSTYRTHSPLAEQMRSLIEEKISDIAEKAVRERFEEVARERITAAVDAVLAEGWQRTDEFGNKIGEHVDLKGRISQIITEKRNDGYNRPALTLAERLVKESVEKMFADKFGKEIEAAQKDMRKQLDAVVAGKFTETIKRALGVA